MDCCFGSIAWRGYSVRAVCCFGSICQEGGIPSGFARCFCVARMFHARDGTAVSGAAAVQRMKSFADAEGACSIRKCPLLSSASDAAGTAARERRLPADCGSGGAWIAVSEAFVRRGGIPSGFARCFCVARMFHARDGTAVAGAAAVQRMKSFADAEGACSIRKCPLLSSVSDAAGTAARERAAGGRLLFRKELPGGYSFRAVWRFGSICQEGAFLQGSLAASA